MGVIFLYHTTKDRWDWTKGLKRFGFVAVGLIVIGAGTFTYFIFERDIKAAFSKPSLTSATPAWKKAPIVRTKLWDIELGDSKEDVLFLKGKPKEGFEEVPEGFELVPNNTKPNGVVEPVGSFWTYIGEDKENWSIFFDKDGKVTEVLLYNGKYESSRLHGIRTTFSYKRVERKLGPPDKIEKSEDKTLRTYFYNKLYTKFVMAEGKVVALGIFQPDNK